MKQPNQIPAAPPSIIAVLIGLVHAPLPGRTTSQLVVMPDPGF